jgi:hypothetical protein
LFRLSSANILRGSCKNVSERFKFAQTSPNIIHPYVCLSSQVSCSSVTADAMRCWSGGIQEEYEREWRGRGGGDGMPILNTKQNSGQWDRLLKRSYDSAGFWFRLFPSLPPFLHTSEAASVTAVFLTLWLADLHCAQVRKGLWPPGLPTQLLLSKLSYFAPV